MNELVNKLVKGSSPSRADAAATGRPSLRLAAERGRALVEESREIVVVLDRAGASLAASRRAREPLDGVVEGVRFPRSSRRSAAATPLEIPYEVGRAPGDAPLPERPRRPRRLPGAAGRLHRRRLARAAHAARAAAGPARDGAAPGRGPVELIDQARGEVDRIGELIDDVLFLSELESGRAVVSLGSIRALPVLDQVVAEARAERGARRASSSGSTARRRSSCRSRQRMLQVIVENLVENAIRYAGAGATCTLSAARGRAATRIARRLGRRARRRGGGPAAPLRALLPRRPRPIDSRHRPRARDRQARRRGRRRHGRGDRERRAAG